ncbi:hypothetical protein [Rummeliibacillus pycnus]|uniref:hypothetical protein n=1 Tax=Rummeliibacillus pycnus TaxID=101070 RepID=UPI003D2D5966
MSLYEELLRESKPRIDDFFKNVTLFENQFTFDDFNKECVKKMYDEVSPEDEIKTVKQLKSEISELALMCKKCGPYFVKPRNKSIKALDVQLGRLLEDLLIDFFGKKLKLKAVHADNQNKSYPDCMILNTDKGILAYFEVKYHGAPFINASNVIKRWCYEGSATLDYKKITKQLELIESDLDRPTFYLHWIDYPCFKGIYFETSEQVKNYIYDNGVEFERAEREGDYIIRKKVGYTEKIYSPLHTMGTFEEFVEIIRAMKKEGVKPLEY